MKAKIHDRHANVVISFNTQNETILSPDKQFQLIPCDSCGELVWKELNVVAFLCPPCLKEFTEQNGGVNPESNVPYQAGYAYACGYHD